MRLTGLEKSQKGHQPAANTQHTDEQGKEEERDDRRGKVSQEWRRVGGGESQSGVEVIQVLPQSPTSYRPWD